MPDVPSAKPAPQSNAPRITSIDAYRGFVMFLMLAECLHLASVAKQFPESELWQTLKFHTTHVEWRGCSLHDLIQPSFSFLVGVALPFSIAGRTAKGHSFVRMTGHALWRSVLLIGLGIFLRSDGRKSTNFTFEDTLTQIGLGYFFLFLLGFVRPRWAWVAVGVILVGYWGAFALYPAPTVDFRYTDVGVPESWPHHASGLASHWNKNSNLAWNFDTWFLNLFPRENEFFFNGGGYATLSFIPTLATMILGLIAGTWLKTGGPSRGLMIRLILAGVGGLMAGTLLDSFGICPSVKRIWTPSWTLYSGGICFLMLAGFVLLFDLLPLRSLAFPLCVFGANSLFIYTLSHLIEGWIVKTMQTHAAFVERRWQFRLFEFAGPEYATIVRGLMILAVYWLLLVWMERRKRPAASGK
jgi:heparan-alpha-glucosaminide N-acetyltransferase